MPQTKKDAARGAGRGNEKPNPKASKEPFFLGGAVTEADLERLPLDDTPRVAFAGRSNVGKSSLLNSLTDSKIARVSSAPGKTREMNFFKWKYAAKNFILVDLPGYGFAKVPASLRSQWGREISQWLKLDDCLGLVVALVDGRHGYMENDVELVGFLRENNLPFVVAFTKMDKWKSSNQRRVAERDLTAVSQKLGVDRFIFVSSFSKDGIRPLEAELRKL